MISIKTQADLEKMRIAGRITARICAKIVESIYPGITTGEINAYAAQLIREAGAKSAFLGYRGFPGSICISVNEAVVHGIPGRRRVQIGDLVSLDVGVIVDAYIGDMATSVLVGVSDPGVIKLVAVAKQALEVGVAHACAGNRVSDISHAIEKVATAAGFSVVRDFVGHGIGRTMHEEPQIPNFGPPGKGPKLKAGMTLAIEPMINMGGSAVEVLSDGWTVVTKDRKPSAHFEHTIAVGEQAAEVLTRVD